jgi:hypothetical protein
MKNSFPSSGIEPTLYQSALPLDKKFPLLAQQHTILTFNLKFDL